MPGLGSSSCFDSYDEHGKGWDFGNGDHLEDCNDGTETGVGSFFVGFSNFAHDLGVRSQEIGADDEPRVGGDSNHDFFLGLGHLDFGFGVKYSDSDSFDDSFGLGSDSSDHDSGFDSWIFGTHFS